MAGYRSRATHPFRVAAATKRYKSLESQIARHETSFKPLSPRAKAGKLFSEPYRPPRVKLVRPPKLNTSGHHGIRAITPHGPGGARPFHITSGMHTGRPPVLNKPRLLRIPR